MVDAIVDEMAQTGPAAEAYAKWCELRLEVLRTYMKDPPHPGPLSKQKELKHIRNIVVAEAAKLARGEFVFEPTPIDRAEFPAGEDDGFAAQEQTLTEPWALSYRRAKVKLHESRECEDTEEQRTLVDDAAELFKKAAIGEPYGVAAFALARLYLKGDDLPRDVFEAVRWLERSSGQGSSYAGYALAMVYLKDGEIAKDVPYAISLLEQSTEGGNAFAL
jgi:TPR repeat protein